VRAEVRKIMAFWLRLGVSGFRMDAAPFVIESTRPNEPQAGKDFEYLTELRDLLSWRRGDGLILAEANVPRDELVQYFGTGDRLPMLFNFLLNQRTFLALARGEAAPILSALEAMPSIPPSCQWATFLRNHDEIDLGRLGDKERAEVFEAFGPDPDMQLYDRGIRRRLAPMLGGDRRRLEMAYALQFCLPGTPVIRYGEEIGMGDDLSLKEREAIRTPMQWTPQANAGFSSATPGRLCRPIISEGDFSYERVNVVSQRGDAGSLLSWMGRMLHTVRECPEFGVGQVRPVDSGDPSVLALRHEAPTGVMLSLVNLADQSRRVDLGPQPGNEDDRLEVFANRDYGPFDPRLQGMELDGYGYRWIRLARGVV